MIELHIRSIEDIEPPHDNTALEISPDMWPYGDSDQHGDPLREHLHTHERFTLDQIRRDVLGNYHQFSVKSYAVASY